jgi:hypothetical protein
MAIKIHTTEARVEFAKNNIGSVSITAIDNKIHLQDLIGEHKVGDIVEDKDIEPRPIVELEFHSVKSIDALIEMLNVVKSNMSNPLNQLALAC